MRLLRCFDCRSIDTFPDPPRGVDPHNISPGEDPLLDELVQRHTTNGVGHVGQMLSVEDEHWNNPETRKEILAKMGEGHTGFEQEFYDVRDTFQEDALKCFAEHHRPERCIDWLSDRKALGRATPEGKAWQKQNQKAPQTYLCHFCLSGDTEVVTRTGIRRIEELVGTAELLIPTVNRWAVANSRGVFREVEVRSFGEQRLWEVTLQRRGQRRVVHATAEHRWMAAEGGVVLPTTALSEGQRLKPLRATPARGKEQEVPFAVAQGFVFGDGSLGRKDHRPATLTFYAEKDKAMLGYFSLHEPKLIKVNGTTAWQVNGLPRHWKNLPPLDESRPYLFSWLAGYFAADGTVDARGLATINSSVRKNLEFVRSLAAICGVGTGRITEKQRLGYGPELSTLYGISLDVRDLPEWFWVMDHHRERVVERQRMTAQQAQVHRSWRVVGVRETDRIEEVFCAVVPGVEAFALADDLMTGNCPVASKVRQAQRDAHTPS